MTVDDPTTGTRLDRRFGGCDSSHGPNPKSARHRGSPRVTALVKHRPLSRAVLRPQH